MTDAGRRLALLDRTARAVGDYANGHFRSAVPTLVETKGPADYVSAVDRGAEEMAREMIARDYPGEPIVGEETGGSGDGDYWIIDPIDGTANFLSGLPVWGVSIAFISNGVPRLGAIALPALSIQVSGGADVGVNAGTSTQARNGATALAFGIGRNGYWPPGQRRCLEERVEALDLHIVTLGSCAASLAFVALGRLAGYVEDQTQLWDCAAGFAICQAAGMMVAIVGQGDENRVGIRAMNDDLFARLQP